MELRQLKYFIRVADCLNFSEAAKESCISQSTLSQQIKQLEQELGSELFLRNSRTVSLTEAGMELLPYARTTIKDADACIERIRDLKDILTGTMNIGVTYSFSPILTETIFSFIKKYPKVKLNIFYQPMSELMDMLRDRKVDFVLAFKPSAPMEGIESHILFQNYLAAIVSSTHSLASEKKVSLEQIAQHGIALPSKGLQARNMLDKVLERYNFNLKARIELNDPDILLNLVRQSNLVTVLAEASIHNERGVKAVPIDIPDNEMVGCVHTLEDSYRKHSMLEFIKMLCESVAVRERINSWL